MRVLVTNDDGVDAPGLAALTRALVAWADAEASSGGPRHEIVVVAPSSNFSGAGAAVGSVTDGTRIVYQRARVSGAEGVDAYGLDASPALSVIAGALGAVGPKPDLVLSGINHGVNVGRSVLHSGTVGAALTASQLGISALAVSEILGLRWARVSGAGLIKAASGTNSWEDTPNRPEMEGPAAAEGARAVIEGGPAEKGEILLSVGSPFPRSDDGVPADPHEDATLVAQGYAAVTALRGPRADDDPGLIELLDGGLAAALAHLGLSG
jgi:5'-nucleotidase